MQGLLCSPLFVRFICAQMWGHGVLPTALPAPFSATLSPALLVYLRECGATGSASGQTTCPVGPTLRQSRSRHGHASPLCPGCPFLPLLPVWMNVYFLFPWCRTSLPFNFLSVLVVFCFKIVVVLLLVVGGGTVYLRLHLGQKRKILD